MDTWYEAKTGTDQGLIIEEGTGRNIAVTYDKKDAQAIATLPDLIEALQAILRAFEVHLDEESKRAGVDKSYYAHVTQTKYSRQKQLSKKRGSDMDQHQFDNLIKYSLRRRTLFWGCFRQGLRRQFYGQAYGGESYHVGWLQQSGIARTGYLTGFNFMKGRDRK